jgi:hypothetical protein
MRYRSLVVNFVLAIALTFPSQACDDDASAPSPAQRCVEVRELLCFYADRCSTSTDPFDYEECRAIDCSRAVGIDEERIHTCSSDLFTGDCAYTADGDVTIPSVCKGVVRDN